KPARRLPRRASRPWSCRSTPRVPTLWKAGRWPTGSRRLSAVRSSRHRPRPGSRGRWSSGLTPERPTRRWSPPWTLPARPASSRSVSRRLLMTSSAPTDRPHRTSGLNTYLRLLGYVRPHWRAALLALVSMVVAAATEPAFAALIKPMVDGSFVDRDPWLVTFVPLAIMGVFVLRGLTTFGSTYTLSWISRNVVMRIRSELFARLLRLPTGYYDQHATGMLLSKITYDVEQVSRAGTNAVSTIIKDTLTVIGLVAYMAYLSG